MATARPFKKRTFDARVGREAYEGGQRDLARVQDASVETNRTDTSLRQTPSSNLHGSNITIDGGQPERPDSSLSTATAMPSDITNQALRPLYAPSPILVSGVSPPSTNTTTALRPTVTIQADGNATKSNSTRQISANSFATPIADPGAKLDIEALPGVNQDAPKVMPFANTNNSTVPPPVPTGIANMPMPMPDKSQPKPTIAAIADLSPLAPSNLNWTSTASAALESVQFPSPSTVGDAAVSTPSSLLPSITTPTGFLTIPSGLSHSDLSSSASSSSFVEPSSTSSLVLSSSLSFIVISHTEQAKELLSSTSTIPHVYPTSTSPPTPQILTAASSPSSLIVSIVPFVAVTTAPASLSTPISAQPRSGLSPLARSLFILFGVLGAISILIAFGVVCIMRRNRKRAQSRQQRPSNEELKTDTGYGVTTLISANESLDKNPFLTESEKAIVTRAATPDGELGENTTSPSARFIDAVNSFVAKSRRLTYKITP